MKKIVCPGTLIYTHRTWTRLVISISNYDNKINVFEVMFLCCRFDGSLFMTRDFVRLTNDIDKDRRYIKQFYGAEVIFAQ